MAAKIDVCSKISSWVDVLREHVSVQPDATAFTFLTDGEEQEVSLSYAQLDRQARAIAATLQQADLSGGRALLLYPPGLEFISGLLGCWYAGVTAVPAYPPRSAQHPAGLATLGIIAGDARPTAVLTVGRMTSLLKTAEAQLPSLAGVPVFATDEIAAELAETWNAPEINGQTIACLQYTSGSTSSPKGVMLSHANLLFGSQIIKDCFGHKTEGNGVIWLPPYHDMGLIGGILQPLYVGRPTTLMAPAAFLQRPLRWLKAITRFRATTSGGPNFAYELCTKQISDEDRKSLDLSSWDLAFNGAEPIDAGTLDRFAEAFAPCGFRREAFYPCYGLAEATLLASGGEKNAPPIVRRFSAAALSENRSERCDGENAKQLVGSGRGRPDDSIRIVHPETMAECLAGQVGEIWVRGGGIAQGYWQKPAETQTTFGARLAGTGEGPFLRTGDLGFLDGDELFITGRLKDLIIIRGRNHYPQDIEQTAQASHPALRPAGGAAFSVSNDGPERLVLLHEVERTQRNVEPQTVIDAIREQIATRHELQVSAVVLLKPGQILKTSSGKIRRRACRELFLNGSLEPLAQWTQPVEPTPAPTSTPAFAAGERPTAEQLENLIVAQLATALSIPADQIDPAEPFARYGLDSAGAVELAGKLEAAIGQVLPATLFFDHPTVSDLARHLASEPAAAHAATDSSPGASA